MAEHKGQPDPDLLAVDAYEGLRQAILRLTSPQYESIREEIASLIQKLETLQKLLGEISTDLERSDRSHTGQITEINRILQEARDKQVDIEGSLTRMNELLLQEITPSIEGLNKELARVQSEIVDRQAVSERVSPVLIQLISERVSDSRDEFAEAVAPVIGPAIRHQIRDAKHDIIDSLYPLIGQIISKAISEAFRELTRNIDARLHQQLNFRSSFNRLIARLKGVSEAETVLRDSMPYSVQHVFLIHHQNGLLLTHLSASEGQADDLDLISGMLTAIRDFVKDSFGAGEGELEEITHGDQRILLESGQYAYLAVVLEGVEPTGYSHLMGRVINAVNVQYEESLRDFTGDMGQLPEFKPLLAPLFAPTYEQLEYGKEPTPLSRGQKWALVVGIGGILLALFLVGLACIYTVRLWPAVFPGLTPTPTITPTVTVIPTSTPMPSPTLTATATPTLTPTGTASPRPTLTSSITPTPLSTLQILMTLGNLNVRAGPGIHNKILGVIPANEELRILEEGADWFRIAWPIQGKPILEGWVWSDMLSITPVP